MCDDFAMTAFSNGSEYDAWTAHWCRKCARDEVGTAPEGTYCPILSDVIVENKVPPQWSPGTNDLHDRYHCSEFVTGTTPAYPEQWHAHLALSQDRTVVHKVGCALAFGGEPWRWSTDKTMDACREIARLTGWKPCEYCGPFK
jgi:hypothetical protein